MEIYYWCLIWMNRYICSVNLSAKSFTRSLQAEWPILKISNTYSNYQCSKLPILKITNTQNDQYPKLIILRITNTLESDLSQFFHNLLGRLSTEIWSRFLVAFHIKNNGFVNSTKTFNNHGIRCVTLAKIKLVLFRNAMRKLARHPGSRGLTSRIRCNHN